MKDKKKLHIIVGGTHHSKSATRNYIAQRMQEVYNISHERTNQLITEEIEKGSLLPDGRDGFMSTEDPQFDSGGKLGLSFSNHPIVVIAAFLASIAGIVYTLFFIYDRYFKH